jgi:hypothetical protein
MMLTGVCFLQLLNIWLCVSMFVSFMCKPFLLILYIWYFSNVFKCFPFLFTNNTSCYLPVDSYHQHKLEVNVFHLISVLPGFPEPS